MYLTEEEFFILFLEALKAKKNRNLRSRIVLQKSPTRVTVASVTAMSPLPPLKGSPRLPVLKKGNGLSSLAGTPTASPLASKLPPSPRSRVASLGSVASASPLALTSASKLPPSPRSRVASLGSVASASPVASKSQLPPSPRSKVSSLKSSKLPPSPRSVRFSDTVASPADTLLPTLKSSQLPPSPVATRSKLPTISKLTPLK